MTIQEELAKLDKEIEELKKPESERQATVGGVAHQLLSEGIPSLVKGAVALPGAVLSAIISPSESAQTMGKALDDYAYDRWMHPSHILPEAGMIVGGALGGMVGLPSVGAGIGTTLGLAARNQIEHTPWTSGDVGEAIISPLGNLPFAALGAAYRMAKGASRLSTKAATIFTSHEFKPHQIEYADAVNDEARALSAAKRKALNYDKPKALLAKINPAPIPPMWPDDEWNPGRTLSNMLEHPTAGEQLSGQGVLFPEKIQADRFKQRALFNPKDVGEKVSVRKLAPDTVKPDRVPPSQLNLFHPTYMEQPGLFPPTERFRQPRLFDATGLASEPGPVAEKRPFVSLPLREKGNRYRQLALAPKQEKYEQLPMFPGKKVPLFDLVLRKTERAQAALTKPKEMTQLSLALQKQQVESPVVNMRTWDFRPTALREVAQRKLQQLDLGLRAKRAPLVDVGGGEALSSTRLVPVGATSFRAKQAPLFPQAGKPAPHWLAAYEKEQRRAALIQRTQARVGAHVAEQEATLRAGKAYSTDPRLMALSEDEQRLARLSVLDPEYLQLGRNPFAQEMQQAGMLASAFNPHATLNKIGPSGHWLSQNLMDANDLHVTGTHLFRERAHAVMDKYNVQEHDLKTHGLLMVLENHPELHDLILQRGASAIRPWEAQTGNRLNVLPRDYGRLSELSKFRNEMRDQVLDPMWLFALRRNSDPRALAEYRTHYLLPSFTARRAQGEISGDVQALKQALDSLSESEKQGPHGALLQEQHDAMARKLKIATKAADEQDKTRLAAVNTLYRPGLVPGEVINSSFKDKHTDLMFGTGMRSSMDDYASGFLKKAIYDPVMRRANEVIRSAPVDASTRKWMTAYTLDQLGTRRMVQSATLTNYAKRVPGIGKHIKEDSIERAVDTVGRYNATMNLGLNARFYPVNATQLLTNGYGLVGEDGLAHGLMKAYTNWPAAYKEAVENGAVQSGLEHLWNEHGSTARGHVLTRFTEDALSKGNTGVIASEAFNRTVLYHGGKFVAEKEGKTGRAAIRRARDINRMVNHGFSAAERPTFGGTLAGSVLGRYKSFAMNQLSFIKHLALNDPKAAAETLAITLALSGTSGIPLWGLGQDIAAKQFGYNVPNITPFDDVTGTNLSSAFSVVPSLPGTDPLSAENLGGPVLGPVLGAVSALATGDESAGARALWGIAGAFPKRVVQGVDEHLRRGLTTTDSGKPLIQRHPRDVLMTALGAKRGPRAEAYARREDIMRAHEVGDTEGLKAALNKAREAGVVRPQQMLSTAKRLKKQEENKKSVLDHILGR
jgi:hypothetical protein